MADRALYLSGKRQAIELLTHLDDDALERTCVACPEWTIRDVVAHHVHVLREYSNGTLPMAMVTAIVCADDGDRAAAAEERDLFTAAGVADRRSAGLSEILAEWDRVTADMPSAAAAMSLDLTMHLADIHETLGDGRVPDPSLVDDALEAYWFLLLARLANVGAGGVTLDRTDREGALTAKGATAVVAGTSYDLLRTLGSRRTRRQADATLQWRTTPVATRDLVALYGWPSQQPPHD